jgi:hypothetical protein
MSLESKRNKKIKIFAPHNLAGAGFSYKNNQQKLNFLPTFSAMLMLFLILFFSFSGISAFSKNGLSSLPFNLNKNLPQEKINKDNQELQKQISELKSPANSVQEQSQNREIIVIKNTNHTCQLGLSKEKPKNLKLDLEKQGFWFPENCLEIDLKFIQIAKIDNQQTIQNLQQDKEILIQNLDSEKNISAIVYLNLNNNQNTTFDFNLKDFTRLLAMPIFPNENWFSEAVAFDTKRQDDRTFYLSQECGQLKIDSKCSLWVFDNFSGKMDILVEDIKFLSTNINFVETTAKFARNQENYPEELSLIIIPNKNINSLQILTINSKTGDFKSIKDIDKNQEKNEFRKYFR